MNYVNNVGAQRKCLEDNLNDINDLLSQKLGVRVSLRIIERKGFAGEIFYELQDDTNLRELCGVAKYAFETITIGSWGIYWNDDDVVISFNYYYTHPSGGSNGTRLCAIRIKDNNVDII